MDEPIISRGRIRACGKSARAAGKGRDEHGFNWHAVAAIAEWQAGWDEQDERSRASGNELEVA